MRHIGIVSIAINETCYAEHLNIEVVILKSDVYNIIQLYVVLNVYYQFSLLTEMSVLLFNIITFMFTYIN